MVLKAKTPVLVPYSVYNYLLMAKASLSLANLEMDDCKELENNEFDHKRINSCTKCLIAYNQ